MANILRWLQKPGRLPGLLFLFALLVRLGYLYEVCDAPFFAHPLMDEKSYDEWARDIAQGNVLGSEVFYQAPLYPYVLALIYRVFGRHLVIAKLLNALLGAASCLLLYHVGARVFDRRTGLVAAVLMSLYSVFWFYEGLLAKTALTTFLTLLAILTLLRARRARHALPWTLAAVVFGLLVLTRGNALLWIPFLLLWIFLDHGRAKLGLACRHVAAYCVGLAVVIGPVSLRNYVVSHDFVLTTAHGGFNFYLGNGPAATGVYQPLPFVRDDPRYERYDAHQAAERETGRSLSPSEASAFYFREALGSILRDPRRYLSLMCIKLHLFWTDYEIPETFDLYFFERYSVLLRVLPAHFGLIASLGLVGLVVSARQWRRCLLLHLTVLAIVLSVIAFYVVGRYRLLAAPFLLLSTAHLVVWGLGAVRARRQGAVSAAFLAAVLLGLVLIPRPRYLARHSFAQSLVGLAHLEYEGGARREAIRLAEEAVAEDPEAGHIRVFAAELYRTEDPEASKEHLRQVTKEDLSYNAARAKLGDILFEQDKLTESAREYSEAVYSGRVPALRDADRVHSRLGIIHARQERYHDAVKEFQRAIEKNPYRTEAHLHLGTCYRKLGRPGQAEEAWAAAPHATTAAQLHFAATDDSDFQKMSEPKPGDWLHRFDEPGQTFKQYVQSRPNRPTKARSKIVIQPLGPFSDEQKQTLLAMKELAAIWFDCGVELKQSMPLPAKHNRVRKLWGRTFVQYHTTHILQGILKPNLPGDALCYIGITMADLYPRESWNFVFGQASLRERVGVYSLARYYPEFYGDEATEESSLLVLRRGCKIMTHEIGHMFGLQHCIYYECGMNGSNSLAESDRRPIHLCPVCLRKLQWNLGFDVLRRYKRLATFYGKHGLKEEAAWVLNRSVKISEIRE